jgi:hypothetical protein
MRQKSNYRLVDIEIFTLPVCTISWANSVFGKTAYPVELSPMQG